MPFEFPKPHHGGQRPVSDRFLEEDPVCALYQVAFSALIQGTEGVMHRCIGGPHLVY